VFASAQQERKDKQKQVQTFLQNVSPFSLSLPLSQELEFEDHEECGTSFFTKNSYLMI